MSFTYTDDHAAIVSEKLSKQTLAEIKSSQQRRSEGKVNLFLRSDTPDEEVNEICEEIVAGLYSILAGCEAGTLLPIWFGIRRNEGSDEIIITGKLKEAAA